MGLDAMILVFWVLSFKPVFSLSSFTLIEKYFSPSLSAVRVVSSAYLRLLIFLPEILIPDYESLSPTFCMMYSVWKLNRQGYSFDVLLSQFGTSLLFHVQFLTCIQVSQEAGKVVWYSHLYKNFPKCVVIYTVKERLWHSQWSRRRCFPGILLPFLWSSRCWQFDLWFLCLF